MTTPTTTETPAKDRFGHPLEITTAMLPQWAEHSDATIARDLADTEYEIDQFRRVQDAERAIAASHPNDNERRLAEFRADGRTQQIAERDAFCAFLRRLQAARAAAAATPDDRAPTAPTPDGP